jgi:hypothetical protein
MGVSGLAPDLFLGWIETECFRSTLTEVFGSVGTLLLLTYRQVEAKN